MATKQSTIDYLLEQMREAPHVSSRKMFGEYALYCDGKVVALVCDGRLFVKPTKSGREIVGEGHDAPPYPGAKMYLLISEEQCEDSEWLSTLILRTSQELPLPKIKKKIKL